MQPARLELVGFLPGHVPGVRGTVPDGIARCRGDLVRRLLTGRAWRFNWTIDIIRAYAGHQLQARAHADGHRRRVRLAVGQISCQVGLTKVECQTGTPAQAVTMSGIDGTYTTCTGQQCIGNPGDGTPTLAYGTETGVGPFLCESATTGVTCTTTNDRGFQISRSRITSVSG